MNKVSYNDLLIITGKSTARICRSLVHGNTSIRDISSNTGYGNVYIYKIMLILKSHGFVDVSAGPTRGKPFTYKASDKLRNIYENLRSFVDMDGVVR